MPRPYFKVPLVLLSPYIIPTSRYDFYLWVVEKGGGSGGKWGAKEMQATGKTNLTSDAGAATNRPGSCVRLIRRSCSEFVGGALARAIAHGAVDELADDIGFDPADSRGRRVAGDGYHPVQDIEPCRAGHRRACRQYHR